MPRDGIELETEIEVSSEIIETALARLLESQIFANSERLKSFLSYVVTETLAGRASQIKGKTIAQDVYGRNSKDIEASVVRVDAGRLRGKLLEYYSTDGVEAPVRIYIDSGQYAPRFETVSEPAQSGLPPEVTGTNKWHSTAFIAFGIVTLSVLSAWIVWPSISDTPKPVADNSSIERQALFENSPSTLQAVNLTKQANGLLFPIADFSRQKLAAATFKEAIRIQDRYAGSYAGAAHSLATLAILAPNDKLQSEFLEEAQQMAAKALELDAKYGWSQSAASWVAFASKDFDEAIRLSNRAFMLDPHDGNILDFHAAVHLLTGRFEKAREIADPNRKRVSENTRVIHRNAFGVASYHLGFFEEAIRSFQIAAEAGDPISELSLTFLAVSHQGAGRTDEAEEIVEKLRRNWPNFRPEIALPKFYQHQEDADQVLNSLEAAGWQFSP